MPLAYGGGIDDVDVAKRIFDIGFEKVSLNTSALNNPNLITEVANIYGSQAVIVSIDVKKDFFLKRKFSKTVVYIIQRFLSYLAKEVEAMGAGETY